MSMRMFMVILLAFCVELIFSQADTTHTMKVVFLYGSKPKFKHRKIEKHYFGGIHGGHVSIQVDDYDYGFEPLSTKGVHIFAKKKRASRFAARCLNNQSRYAGDTKTATIIIPITHKQYSELNKINKCYCDTTPFDYAFFGMRCASTAQDILSQIGIVKKKKRFNNIVTTFYPKKLRKRLFKLAKKNNYTITRTEGRPSRKWERD
jgi:hypothetical protein